MLERKEIENYLLVPAALDRAVVRMLSTRREHRAEKIDVMVNSAAILDEITRPLKDDVLSQLMARRHDYFHQTGQDKSRVYKGTLSTFERRWSNLDARIALVPGKLVLGLFRHRIQDLLGVTLTDARIAEAMSKDDIPSDIRSLLGSLESFRTALHQGGATGVKLGAVA